ncbi:flagellar assembly protein FliW [Candidatus Eisenbacteria bacterium]|uniref:Flagellar assembly factor FliW n=1 Tax=Eiseniibacteriota bacterium TaxID=2212470 RepID=A0ABV6YKK0_UNCEI
MKIETREWGTLDVADDSIVHFKSGFLGFEDHHDFVFVDVEEFKPFLWFLSVDDPTIGFAVADPFYFSPDSFDVNLSAGDEDKLDLREGDSIAVFVVVSIEDNGCKITANLKGPIVLNTRNRRATQLVIYNASACVNQPILNRRTMPLSSAVQGAATKSNAAA